MTPIRKTFAFAALLCVPLLALAAPDGDCERDGRDHPPRPPVEAIEACASLQVDDVCTFEHRDRTESGVCHEGPREDLPLACRPDREPRS